MRLQRVLISGGGTGGHIFPAIAIADALKKIVPDVEILFIGAKGRMEMEIVPSAGYSIESIEIEGFNRNNILANVSIFFKVWKSINSCKSIIKHFNAQIAIGTGGFVSGPVLWAAANMRLPIFIQEQNSVPGITNRILAHRAKLIFTAYPAMEKYFNSKKIIYSGNPVRSAILNSTPGRENSCAYFGFNPTMPVLFVYGGSQGSVSINKALISSLVHFEKNNIQVLWQTGKLFFEDALNYVRDNGLKLIKIFKFINEMQYAYGASNLCISRAGAMAISELALKGVPAILVPLPSAAHNHQYHNAMTLDRAGAAICLEEVHLENKLSRIVLDLIFNNEKLKQYTSKISQFARPGASESIVETILSTT